MAETNEVTQPKTTPEENSEGGKLWRRVKDFSASGFGKGVIFTALAVIGSMALVAGGMGAGVIGGLAVNGLQVSTFEAGVSAGITKALEFLASPLLGWTTMAVGGMLGSYIEARKNKNLIAKDDARIAKEREALRGRAPQQAVEKAPAMDRDAKTPNDAEHTQAQPEHESWLAKFRHRSDKKPQDSKEGAYDRMLPEQHEQMIADRKAYESQLEAKEKEKSNASRDTDDRNDKRVQEAYRDGYAEASRATKNNEANSHDRREDDRRPERFSERNDSADERNRDDASLQKAYRDGYTEAARDAQNRDNRNSRQQDDARVVETAYERPTETSSNREDRRDNSTDTNGRNSDSTAVERNTQTSETYRERPIEVTRYNETNYYAAPANNGPENGTDNSTATQTQNWNLQDPSLNSKRPPAYTGDELQDPMRRNPTSTASPDVININVERHEHHHYGPDTDITAQQAAPQPTINTQLGSGLADQSTSPDNSFASAELKRRTDRELAGNIKTL